MNEWELTEREVVDAWLDGAGIPKNERQWIDLQTAPKRHTAIAQAAQKKLAEWLKTKGFYHDVGVLSGTTKVILPIFAIEEENWQELCKGVELDKPIKGGGRNEHH